MQQGNTSRNFVRNSTGLMKRGNIGRLIPNSGQQPSLSERTIHLQGHMQIFPLLLLQRWSVLIIYASAYVRAPCEKKKKTRKPRPGFCHYYVLLGGYTWCRQFANDGQSSCLSKQVGLAAWIGRVLALSSGGSRFEPWSWQLVKVIGGISGPIVYDWWYKNRQKFISFVGTSKTDYPWCW